METIHLEYYILCLLGTVIHYLKDWAAYRKQGLKYGWEKAIPTMILSFVTTQLLIYLRDDIKEIYPITAFSAVVLGYVGNSAFFGFVDAKKPINQTQNQEP